MIEIQTEKTSYNWLVLFIILSTFALFRAGFDHYVVFYGVLLMTVSTGFGLVFNKDSIEINRVFIVYALFTLWALISIIWSISPIRTVIEGLQLIGFGLIYIMARKLTLEGLDKLYKVLFLLAGGIALLGILEYLFVSGSRIHATFTNPNPFGIYMVMMFLVVLSLAIRTKFKINVVMSILFLSVVYLSGSRASLGAMSIALIISFFGIEKEHMKNAVIKAMFIFISAFIFAQIFMYGSILIRENVFVDKSLLESITRSNSFVTSSLKGRLEFWRVAVELFKNKPLTGYGNGTYFSSYYIEYGTNEWYSRFTHNHYLQIASELGLVGIILFMGFLWAGFKSVLFNAKQNDKSIYFWGMVAGLVAFLLHIGVDFTWNFPAVTALFFFFLGLTTKEAQKASILINKKIAIMTLSFIIVLTTWQLGSTKLYMRAIDLEQTKSIEAALNLTKIVNRMYPISSFGQSYESELFYKKYLTTNVLDGLSSAFTAMEKALKNAPYDAGINTKMAKLYQNTGDFKRAEEYYQIATRYSAYTLHSFIEFGNMYIMMDEKNQAKSVFLDALERAPYTIKRAPADKKEETVDSVAIIHLTLANLYNETGDHEKVQEQINMLIDLKEDYPFLDKYFVN
ncbi:MAG: O-antigen ligase family protein [Clostridiales bacterium]|nr:O-antigen ligase family protein [Clostridiales bacterium]